MAVAAMSFLACPAAVQTATAQIPCETDADCGALPGGEYFCHEAGLCVCEGTDECYYGLWDSFQNQCLDCKDILGESCIEAAGICEWNDFSNECKPVGLDPKCDCQPNGIRDECDLDCYALQGDCNVPDCGESVDANTNGIPDECDIPCVCHGDVTEACTTSAGATVSFPLPEAVYVPGDAYFLGDCPDDYYCADSQACEPYEGGGAVLVTCYKVESDATETPINASGGIAQAAFPIGETLVRCYTGGLGEVSVENDVLPDARVCEFIVTVTGGCDGPRPCSDVDKDKICDYRDNCVYTPNGPQLGTCMEDTTQTCLADADCGADGPCSMDQEDADGDGVGDVCDNCPDVVNPPNPATGEQNDDDGDGIGDACDNCPEDPNENQSDVDDDGLGDVCDDCDLGPNDDADGDGVFDACDLCPEDADSTNADSDGDSIGDVCDNCPNVPNEDQADADGDGVGDACEEETPPVPVPDCTEDADCDDGDLCTTDACVDGECVNTPVVCPEGYICDPETGECVAEERPPPQAAPRTRGGCGIYNGVGLIALPLSMLLWVGARLHTGRRRRQ